MILLAAIAFGPLGPLRHQSFDDGVVRARVTYRIAHDRYNDAGPAAVAPSIAAGFLTMTVAGNTRTIDLTSLFPIHDERIDFAEPVLPYQGCGVGETLSRRGDYLAIQAIVAQKGCAAVAVFVDIKTDEVLEDVVVDPLTRDGDMAEEVQYSGLVLVVRRSERVTLNRVSWEGGSRHKVAWPFVIVHAQDPAGNMHVFAFDALRSLPDAPPIVAPPAVGSSVTIGSVMNHRSTIVRYLEGERVLRLD